MPRVLIAAEDVLRGKPAPDCFLLATERVGGRIADCPAFVDAPAGAAEGAGASVGVVTATHAHPLAMAHRRIDGDGRVAAGLRRQPDARLSFGAGPPAFH